MKILKKYQLEIIFLFFGILLIIWSTFYGLKYLGADPHDYEWFIAGPLLILYFFCLMLYRKKINIHDRRALTAKTLIYWLLLGISIFSTYSTPIPAADYWSINILYIMLTLFLADSYWDFANKK